jgi:serine/threonine-protein kinase
VTRAPSTLLGDRYALVDRLAVGGMGEVWCADDSVLGRGVAIKILRDEYAGDPTFRQRFRAEAQHAALLVHPNVAQVFDFNEGDDASGTPPWLVMELIRGEPLSELIAREAPLPPERVWSVVGQAASALAAAHAAGVVHRDIKPANLLLCADGTVKVTDFGIARAAGSSSVTATGLMLGTPHYLSPEQVAGQQARSASDFYALGVVAYECLTGRRPFEGEPVAVLLAHRDRPAPPVPGTAPPALRDLVTALLDKDPARRPTDGRAIAEQAERMLAGPPDLAPAAVPAAPPAPAPAPAAAYPDEPAGADVVPDGVAPDPAGGSGPETSVMPVLSGPVESEVDSPPRVRRRLPAWVIAALAAAVCFAAAGIVAVTEIGGGSKPARHPAAAAKAATLAPAHVASAQPFAGSGGSSDHPEEAALAIDGDRSTSWFTQHYATASFGGLHSGAGLVLDLGAPVDVKRLSLQLAVPGAAVAVYAGDSESSLLSAKAVGSSSSAASTWVLRPGVTARYWLVWFTRLAPSDGAFRAGVAEAAFAR